MNITKTGDGYRCDYDIGTITISLSGDINLHTFVNLYDNENGFSDIPIPLTEAITKLESSEKYKHLAGMLKVINEKISSYDSHVQTENNNLKLENQMLEIENNDLRNEVDTLRTELLKTNNELIKIEGGKITAEDIPELILHKQITKINSKIELISYVIGGGLMIILLIVFMAHMIGERIDNDGREIKIKYKSKPQKLLKPIF